jgi:hypothetical protein
MIGMPDDETEIEEPSIIGPNAELDEREVLSIISNELQLADQGIDFVTPLDYYVGNPNGREIEGRSSVISTDVADAVEWIMPQIMKALTQTNEVVIFDPVGPGDELQAELESKYVYDVIMKENPGFITIHEFIKDALLQNYGVIKVYFEDEPTYEVQEFTGLVEEQVVVATQAENVEVLEFETQEDGTFELKIRIKTPHGRIVLEAIPPEQFRFNADHNSVSLEGARFLAHVTNKTASDLIKEGFDREVIERIGSGTRNNLSDYRFAAQDETTTFPDQSQDWALRMLEVAECYMQLDINGDGIAEYVKITVAGADIGTPTDILSSEEISYNPFIGTTAILMPHKFRGLSIYDRLKQIQDQKTALLRSILDNVYLQNNGRTVVVEGMVNMDDLLVSRPGGVVRAKRLDAVSPLATPQLSAEAYNMMQYLDQVRAGRVGVSPEGEATPQKIGARVGSEGVDRLLTAKEELVGLIVRVIAETGIKPLCNKVRDLCTMHLDGIQDYQFRGMWVKTNPAQWPNRRRMTVRVGTGTGDHQAQVNALGTVLSFQEKIIAQPGQAMVLPQNVYAALDDFAKFSQLNGANKYFLDPNSPQGQQNSQAIQQSQAQQAQQSQQENMALLQAQVDTAQAQVKMAQAQQDNVVLKGQVENLKLQLSDLKTRLEAINKDEDRKLRKYEIDERTAIELTRIEVDAQSEENANFTTNKTSVSGV